MVPGVGMSVPVTDSTVVEVILWPATNRASGGTSANAPGILQIWASKVARFAVQPYPTSGRYNGFASAPAKASGQFEGVFVPSLR